MAHRVEPFHRRALRLLRPPTHRHGGVAIADTADILAADGLDDEHCLLLVPPSCKRISTRRPHVAVTARTGVRPGLVPPCMAASWCPSRLTASSSGRSSPLDASAPAGLLRLTTRWPSSSRPSWNWPSSTARGAGPTRRSCGSCGPDLAALHLQRADGDRVLRPDRPGPGPRAPGQFADFIRYSFRSHGQFVTMAEEIRLVDTYLDLERARSANGWRSPCGSRQRF